MLHCKLVEKLCHLRCLAALECWTPDLTSPTTPSLSLTAAASSRQVFLKADNKADRKATKNLKLKLLFLRLRTCLTPTFPWTLRLTWWSCSGDNVNHPPVKFVAALQWICSGRRSSTRTVSSLARRRLRRLAVSEPAFVPLPREL